MSHKREIGRVLKEDLDCKGFGLRNIARRGEHFFIMNFTVAANQTNKRIGIIISNDLLDNLYIEKICVNLENDPGGAAQSCTLEVTDGTTTMSAVVNTGSTSGSSTTNAFDLNVTAANLTIQYDSSATCATGAATAIIVYHNTGE